MAYQKKKKQKVKKFFIEAKCVGRMGEVNGKDARENGLSKCQEHNKKRGRQTKVQASASHAHLRSCRPHSKLALFAAYNGAYNEY